MIDQHSRVVLGQVGVRTTAAESGGEPGTKSGTKSGEIAAFAPLLDTLERLDLHEVVVTADALHTQRRRT